MLILYAAGNVILIFPFASPMAKPANSPKDRSYVTVHWAPLFISVNSAATWPS